MSLVAYTASSDEDSEFDDDDNDKKENDDKTGGTSKINKFVNDEDDFFASNSNVQHQKGNNKLMLPPTSQNRENEKKRPTINQLLNKLPAPNRLTSAISKFGAVPEEDDEFLHKKAIPQEKPPRAPVKIVIPALSEFKEPDSERKVKFNKSDKNLYKPVSSLLGILPKPKSEQFEKKNTGPTNTNNYSNQQSSNTNIQNKSSTNTISKSLIPDSVKNRAQLANKTPKTKPNNETVSVNVSDDSDGTSEEEDFFSLNSEEKLPDVSMNEINAMVAKKAAKMAEATNKFDAEELTAEETDYVDMTNIPTVSKEEDVLFDQKAIQALVGSQAKKRKTIVENVEVVELSSQQVLPNRGEWMRAALASETAYQPKGVLVNEEPAPGTRKKHQITYLAHQAKTNEAELQAMWAQNRQNRRATASKYGF